MKRNKKGWTEWIFPRMLGYNLGCCDCSLWHTLQFRIWDIKNKRFFKNGDYKVSFRVKRNDKKTRWERKTNHIVLTQKIRSMV